jgi:ABC-type bacteriocin/lantibiotic exporter with double-glycine peptidase domain
MVSLDVPLYQQTMDFSCGPASLLMAFHYHDASIPLDQGEEVAIWRDTNMVAIWGAARYGMAHASLLRGFGTQMISNSRNLGFAERIKVRRPDIDMNVMEFFFGHSRSEARRLGLKETIREPVFTDAKKALEACCLPIALISTRLFEEDDIPHWVVVSGIEEGKVIMNNPLGKDVESYQVKEFERYFGFSGERTLLIIGKRGRGWPRAKGKGLTMKPPSTRYVKQVEL